MIIKLAKDIYLRNSFEKLTNRVNHITQEYNENVTTKRPIIGLRKIVNKFEYRYCDLNKIIVVIGITNKYKGYIKCKTLI